MARTPLVALVGRPNVGKSTLFNRLVGRRTALVDDQPGVTRDRLFGEIKHAGRVLRVVDTGGFDPAPGDDLVAGVRDQVQLAIDEADLVLLVLDAEAGLTPTDQEIATLLRRAGKPSLAIANKIDVPQHEARLADLYALGMDPLIGVSAEHGRGVGDLCELLCIELDAPLVEASREAPLPVSGDELPDGEVSRIEFTGGPIRVAIIGRPNVGKSSLANRVLGQQRLLESEMPGTTRDAVDIEMEHDGQTFVLIDTAGIRRRRSIAQQIEKFSVMVALRSLDRADVALVLFDAAVSPAEQDAKVAALAHERGKGVVLVANKWDLVGSEEQGRGWVQDLRHRLPFVAYAPLFRTSAKTGRGISRLLPAVLAAQKERHRRVGTSELNRFFKKVIASHTPPVRRGKRPRLYYVSQPLIRPPTFVFSASHAGAIPESYRRYLAGALRDRYGFAASPIWVKLRGR